VAVRIGNSSKCRDVLTYFIEKCIYKIGKKRILDPKPERTEFIPVKHPPKLGINED